MFLFPFRMLRLRRKELNTCWSSITFVWTWPEVLTSQQPTPNPMLSSEWNVRPLFNPCFLVYLYVKAVRFAQAFGALKAATVWFFHFSPPSQWILIQTKHFTKFQARSDLCTQIIKYSKFEQKRRHTFQCNAHTHLVSPRVSKSLFLFL